MRKLFLLGSIVFSLFACSSDVAGGGSSGTEAGNAITAQILKNNQTPAVAARVFVMPLNSLASSEDVLVTTQTDSEGRFSIQNLVNGDYIVEVIDSTGALQFKAKVNDSTSFDQGVDTLKEFSKIEGSVGFASSGIVSVQGMYHQTIVNEEGLFSLDSLPAGGISLVFSQEENSPLYYSYANLYPGASATPSPFALESDRLLLEDFEDLNTQHRFAPYVGDSIGWWFLSAHEDIELLYSDTILAGYPLVKEESQYIAFSATVADTVISPWINFGIQVGGNTSTYDLSGLDSIAFKVKGSGTAVLQFIGIEDPLSYSTTWPQVSFELPAEWTRMAISTDELTSYSIDFLKKVRVISWVFVSTTDFAIDDIELIGLSKETLWY